MTEENPEDAYYNNPAVFRDTYGNFETILITLTTFFFTPFTSMVYERYWFRIWFPYLMTTKVLDQFLIVGKLVLFFLGDAWSSRCGNFTLWNDASHENGNKGTKHGI